VATDKIINKGIESLKGKTIIVFFNFLQRIYKYEGEVLDLNETTIYFNDYLTQEKLLLPLCNCKIVVKENGKI
jgi:hypothetical protein